MALRGVSCRSALGEMPWPMHGGGTFLLLLMWRRGNNSIFTAPIFLYSCICTAQAAFRSNGAPSTADAEIDSSGVYVVLTARRPYIFGGCLCMLFYYIGAEYGWPLGDPFKEAAAPQIM